MTFVIEQPAVASLPVAGSRDRFPVRRIYCIGRNYRAHAIEMGHDPDREAPFFFMKPSDAIVESGARIPYPMATKDLHHEVELVAAIGKGGVRILEEAALEHVWGYGVGLDLTRRDLQGEAKNLRRPWDMGKGFDQSAPVSALRPANEIGHPETGAIWLKVNGEVRQESDLGCHIWTLPETIAILSELVALAPGDLVFMGTPEGVGPIKPGDRLEGHVDRVGDLTVTIGGVRS